MLFGVISTHTLSSHPRHHLFLVHLVLLQYRQELKQKCAILATSLKVVNTTEARICSIPKTIEPALASSAAAPQTTTSSVAPLAQLSKNTGSGNNNSSVTATTTTNVPIVLRSLPGGTCPQGDIPRTTTNATKPFPISSSLATSQPSHTNPTKNDNNNAANSNNEEIFHTKILKSFNKKFK